jgi:hypothetical protein
MPQFKIEMELTSVNERILLTDFDSTQSKLEGLTFNETLNQEENDRYTLSFQLVGKSGRAREIPLGKLISIGRPVWLYTTNPDRAIRMVITSYSPVIGSENLVYNIECQDYASYVFARNNVGLTLDTIEDEDYSDWINLLFPTAIDPIPIPPPAPPTFVSPPTFVPPNFAPDELTDPVITQSSRTSNSISWIIRNNNETSVSLFWDVSTSSSIEPVTDRIVLEPNTETTAAALNLDPNTTYYIGAQFKKAEFTDSNIVRNTWSTLQLTTAIPSTAAIGSTASSVTFRLTQNDAVAATMSWKIRSGSSTGTEVDSDITEATNQNGTRDITISNLSSGTTYWLTDVTATATNKLQSGLAIERSIDTEVDILQLATPIIQRDTRTTSSISWTITNDSLESVELFWNISTSSSVQPTTSRGQLSPGGQALADAAVLQPNTTYYIAAQVRKTGFTNSEIATDNWTTLQLTTTSPITEALSSTSSSVTFRLRQTDPVDATMAWQIILNSFPFPVVGGNTTPLTNQNGTREVSATGLDPDTEYKLTGVTATAIGKLTSNLAEPKFLKTLVAPPPPPSNLEQPQPSNLSGYPTSTEIALNVFNPNTPTVTMFADISTNSNVSAVTNRGFIGGFNTGTLSFDNLNPSTLYYIAIRFSASGRNDSSVTIQRTTLANVTVSALSNPFGAVINYTVGSFSGSSDTVVVSVSAGSSYSFSAPSSFSGGAFANWSGGSTSTSTNITGTIGSSNVTFTANYSAAPPFFPPFFPPNFVPPFFPPFFPPDFTPFVPPPNFGGCLHEDTLMTMFDGTQKLLKDIVIGDELMGYHIDGMIDEEEPGWENWTTENHLSGEIVPVTVTGVKQDAYSSYYLINNDIKITKQHRFFASTDAITWTWIDSTDLKVGDKLLDIDKNIIEITSKLYIQEALHVVVLDVETTDNYFVGQSNILIHNSDEFK